MRRDEAVDAGELAGTALGELTEVVRDVHRAIAGRVFTATDRLTGGGSAPVRLAHDGIAGLVYTATRVGLRYGPVVGGLATAALRPPAAPSVHDEPRGRAVLGAVSGFWGDRMTTDQPALAPQLRLRLHEGPLRRLPGNLTADAAEAEPPATGRLVVFLHGLCESDRAWSYAAAKRWGDPDGTYGSLLRDAAGWTPLYATFNTGVHICANARELAEWLDAVVAGWPVEVTEVALVGHSLGGLVARGAAEHAHDAGLAWLGHLRQVVMLGTPHLGAPLERFANWGSHQLARLPETRPVAAWLNRRSVGIKDLRYGALAEADWAGFDPDELLTDHCAPPRLLPGVAYSAVSATLSREPRGPLAHDLLVTHRSAHGAGTRRAIPFEAGRTLHVGGGRHHFDLLADHQVYEQLLTWLGGPDARAAQN